MSFKVFDMGKNLRGNEYAHLFESYLNSKKDFEAYVQGRVDQFCLDLLISGKAVMPNGETVHLFDETKGNVRGKAR